MIIHYMSVVVPFPLTGTRAGASWEGASVWCVLITQGSNFESGIISADITFS